MAKIIDETHKQCVKCKEIGKLNDEITYSEYGYIHYKCRKEVMDEKWLSLLGAEVDNSWKKGWEKIAVKNRLYGH